MLSPAPLLRRTFALSYESLLIGSVTILAGLIAGVVKTVIERNAPALSALIMPISAMILLYAWWFYFKINWIKEGQTLPMRVWKIGLHHLSGNPPTLKQLRLRFVWACVFLVFIPLIAYIMLKQMGFSPKIAFFASLIWWILPWGFAWLNPRRAFLYDYLSETELTDLRETPKNN